MAAHRPAQPYHERRAAAGRGSTRDRAAGASRSSACTSARPSPVPPFLPVKYGSKIRSSSSGGTPGPWSRDLDRARRRSPGAAAMSSSPVAVARLHRVAEDVAERAAQRIVVAQQDWASRGRASSARGHAGRQRGARQLLQQLDEVHRRGRPLGQPAELGELARQLLQPARLGDQHLDRLALRRPRRSARAARPRAGSASADSASRAPPGAPPPERRAAAPPRSLRPRPLQRVRHLAQRGRKRGELRRAAARPVGRAAARIRRMWPVQPISSSIGRLSWRERWPPSRTEAYRNAAPTSSTDEAQPGVVVAAEGLGPLEPADGGVELGGVVGERSPLHRRRGGWNRASAAAYGRSAPTSSSAWRAPSGGRRRADRQPPAEDRQRRWGPRRDRSG